MSKHIFWGMVNTFHDHIQVLRIGKVKKNVDIAAILESKMAAISGFDFAPLGFWKTLLLDFSD